MDKNTQIKKRKYVPLHERLTVNTDALEEVKVREEMLKDLYRGVFETDSGQLLIEYLTDKYVGTVPHGTATPNEIMFAAGERYVVLEILSHLRKEK